jgi:hypothetical protein
MARNSKTDRPGDVSPTLTPVAQSVAPKVSARIFICYRTADGMDKATALARDLGNVFGDDQVFLDKDDLHGGSRWREEVAREINQRSVLLLLLTPQLLTATDTAGHLRIADDADPVRREVAIALAQGAQLIPLLCDGVAMPPAGADLPAPFNQLGEFTWRHLRAYDWQYDIEKLTSDLMALDIAPLNIAAPAAGTKLVPRRLRVLGLVFVLFLAALLTTAVGWFATRNPAEPPVLAVDDFAGQWVATPVGEAPIKLLLQQTGDRLSLVSEPVSIATNADWADYRDFWRERFHSELNAIVYRGEGSIIRVPAAATELDMALQIVSSPGNEPIDSGNLHALRQGASSTMDGLLWLNSKQAEKAIRLVHADR